MDNDKCLCLTCGATNSCKALMDESEFLGAENEN